MSHLHRSYDPTCLHVLMSPTNLKCIIVAHLSFTVTHIRALFILFYKFGFSFLCGYVFG
ncbi:unnamed protein product [Prunus brigantina]